MKYYVELNSSPFYDTFDNFIFHGGILQIFDDGEEFTRAYSPNEWKYIRKTPPKTTGTYIAGTVT